VTEAGIVKQSWRLFVCVTETRDHQTACDVGRTAQCDQALAHASTSACLPAYSAQSTSLNTEASIEHGGLGKATRRKLQTMAKALRTTGRVGPMPSLTLKPAARLIREWHGRTHIVTVTEDGFEFAGTSYASLSKIAKTITGTHWSGPRFFGLTAAGTQAPSVGGHNA
jgi:hypothetical protein